MRRREKKQEKKQVLSEQKVLKETENESKCDSECIVQEQPKIVTVTIMKQEPEVAENSLWASWLKIQSKTSKRLNLLKLTVNNIFHFY